MNRTLIRNIVLGVAAFLFTTIFLGCTLTRVDVGHVGVLVKLAGSERGVQDNMRIKTGWVFFNPLTSQVIEFPVQVNNVIFSASPHEGGDSSDKKDEHAVDESITFSSTEGVNANVDVGFSFHIDPQQAPHLYARFRQNNMRELAYGYMRNVIREAFQEVASKMPIQEIYGPGKSKMVSDVMEKCRTALGADGIVIDQLTINGEVRLPKSVQESINAAIAATQAAIQAENKVRQVKAEAEQQIATATGAAESARQAAKGQADALLTTVEAQSKAKQISSQAESQANKTINSSLSPQLLQYKALDTWNGKLPDVVGSQNAIPMIQMK